MAVDNNNNTQDNGKEVSSHGVAKDISGGTDQYKNSFKERFKNVLGRGKGSGHSKDSKRSLEDLEDEEVDLSCGIGRFRTSVFGRKFANLYVFTLFMGTSMLFTQMVGSVISTQLTSLERQFKIDSARAGLFDTASKVGHLPTILLAGHFAKKVNIPLVVGLCGMFQGVLLMIPAFMQIANPYSLPLLSGSGSGNSTDSSHGDNEKYFCYVSNHSNFNSSGKSHEAKEPSDEYNQLAFIIMLVVQAVKGVTDAFHSGFLPTLYVDDNMPDKSKMAIFFGIKYVIGELASPVSKQLNAILTEVPVDLKKTEMDTKDQRFIAAWWLAFLAFGAALTVFSFPIILFPRKLVSRRQQEEALQKAMVSFTLGEEKKEDTINDKMKTSDSLRKPSVAVIGIKERSSVKENGKRSFTPRSSVNRGSVYSHASSRKSSLFPPVKGPVERKISADGSMAFDQPIKERKRPTDGKLKSNMKELIRDFPKALVRVFKRPVFIIMLVDIAIVSIPMSGIGVFRSIYMTSEYNVTMKEVATLTGVSNAVAHVIGTLVSGWLASKVKTRIGYIWIIFTTYLISISISPMYIIFGCGNYPVYGHDGKFGVPINTTDICGCATTKQLLSCGSDGNNYLTPCHAGCLSSSGKTFTNCSGLGDFALNQSMTVVPGLCTLDECSTNFYLYVALHAIQGLIGSMASIPRRLLLLRIVDPSDRAFATSLFAFFGTILGLPSPNLFGKVIDDTCVVKDGDVCNLYDRDKIRYLISGIDVGVNGCVQLTFILMIVVFKWEEKKLKKKLKKEQDGQTGDSELNVKI